MLAISETDPSKVHDHIVEAQSAIMSRIIEVPNSETDKPERDALEEALKVVGLLASAA